MQKTGFHQARIKMHTAEDCEIVTLSHQIHKFQCVAAGSLKFVTQLFSSCVRVSASWSGWWSYQPFGWMLTIYWRKLIYEMLLFFWMTNSLLSRIYAHVIMEPQILKKYLVFWFMVTRTLKKIFTYLTTKMITDGHHILHHAQFNY